MRGLTIGAAAIAAMTMSASAQNLASNGSFETPGPGFILFQDWENYNEVYADMSVELAAQDGTTSAKQFGQFGGVQSDAVLLHTVFGAVPGNDYTLSAYAQHLGTDAVQAGNLVLLQMTFQDAGGSAIGAAIDQVAIDPGVTATDQWIQSSITATAPAGTDRILIALLHLQLDGLAAGATFWDNVELTEGPGMMPCDADFNGDGMLNFFDISAFITAFNAGCP